MWWPNLDPALGKYYTYLRLIGGNNFSFNTFFGGCHRYSTIEIEKLE